MSALFRLHIPARQSDDDAITHCIRHGVVGLGRALPREQLQDIEFAAWLAATVDGKLARHRSRARPRGRWPEPDDLVWARDVEARYYLGRVSGPWTHDESDAAQAADIIHVVPCQLCRVGRADALPSTVAWSFRLACTLHRIDDTDSLRFSQLCWNQLCERPVYAVDLAGRHLFGVLDAKSRESLALIFLQSLGWVVVESARQRDQSPYVAMLVDPVTMDRAILAVSTRERAFRQPLPTRGERSERVFFLECDGRSPEPLMDGITCLDPAEVESFARSHLDLLPGTVALWLRNLDSTQRVV